MILNSTRKSLSLIILVLTINSYLKASNDSLSYQAVVDSILTNNPSIKQVIEKKNTADLKVDLAKASYLPNVSANGSINNMYPIPAFDMQLPDPQSGELVSKHLQMYPEFGMDYNIKVNQLIYDFGKIKSNVNLQETNAELTNLTIDQLKQRLCITAAIYYYSLVYIQSAINIKTDQLNTLKQHLNIVENKVQTGSATQYEILSTKVRISANETQLSDLQSSRQIQISHLNNLMGNNTKEFYAKDDIIYHEYNDEMDSIYSYAIQHRNEILVAEKKVEMAEWNFKIAQNQNNPTLAFFGATGFKNGYLSDVNSLKYNYIFGVNLSIPIFDGNRKNINKQLARSAINDNNFEIDNIRNGIYDEVNENYLAVKLAKQKIEQFKTQMSQAVEAYKQAQVNYSAGTLTNLDLLDASNMLAESKLLLQKANIDYELAIIKFKAAIGERLY